MSHSASSATIMSESLTPGALLTSASTPAAALDVAAGAAVHTLAYQYQRSSTARLSGPTPNPDKEFWLHAPSHPDYSRFLDDFESFASQQPNLSVPMPACLMPTLPTSTLDRMFLPLEQLVTTLLPRGGGADSTWPKALRVAADRIFHAHAQGQAVTFAGQTVTPIYPVPTNENHPRMAYLVFPWSAERTPLVSGSRASGTRQLAAAKTESLEPPALARFASSPATFPAATPSAHASSAGTHPPTLTRSTTTRPLQRALVQPYRSFPPCPHALAPLTVSWAPIEPDRRRMYCCLMRTIKRAIEAGQVQVGVPECFEWILAEDDKDRRDCLVELANFTAWLSTPWILGVQQAGHMFGAEDPCSPRLALRAATNAGERIASMKTKDPVRIGYMLLYTVRQDVVGVLLREHGIDVSEESVDSMFAWVERHERGHINSWYQVLSLLNDYLRHRLATLTQ